MIKNCGIALEDLLLLNHRHTGTCEFNVMHCTYVIISITKFLISCCADLYGTLFYGLQTELNSSKTFFYACDTLISQDNTRK